MDNISGSALFFACSNEHWRGVAVAAIASLLTISVTYFFRRDDKKEKDYKEKIQTIEDFSRSSTKAEDYFHIGDILQIKK